jgi:hypothetical protein
VLPIEVVYSFSTSPHAAKSGNKRRGVEGASVRWHSGTNPDLLLLLLLALGSQDIAFSTFSSRFQLIWFDRIVGDIGCGATVYENAFLLVFLLAKGLHYG